MAIRVEHELHGRRLSRNVGVGLTLVGFAALVFALSVVKMSATGPVQGFDHAVRPELLGVEE